ncbi:MAG TPA: universal stress protein [Candidatus Limnocylindria bacterium]|nr:universal stress protein [Candidatus Limnocylindria bacterium]
MQVKRILVPLAGTSVDPEVLRVAVALGRPAKAEIIAIHVIEVRWNLPLDAVLEAESERGEVLLDDAVKVAEQTGAHIETELLQAREAAAAIIDTARDRKVDLIVLGMPFRKRLGRVYVGRTVESVYVGAQCAVLAYRQEETR